MKILSPLERKEARPESADPNPRSLFRGARSENGVALIIVMVVLTVLGILAGGFAYFMKVEMRLAQQTSLDSEFEWMGRSGVELAKLVLSEQMKGTGNQAGNTVDSYKQRWAGGPGDSVDTNSSSPIQLENVQLVEGGGTFSVKIIDAERKFNINRENAAVSMSQVLQKAMLMIGVDAGASSTMVDSILDWIDPDSNERVGGAESDYYSQLDTPYVAKNGPVADMVELLLVKGIDTDPAVLWGTQSTNANAQYFGAKNSSQLNDREEPPQYRMGLIDLFTPVSNGRVNINTASADVLQLCGLDEATAQAIVSGRQGDDRQDGTADDVPYQSIAELNNRNNIPGLGFGSNLSAVLGPYCGVLSSVFEVQVTCEIGGLRREYIAMVQRAGPSVRTLWMYWKGAAPNVGPTLEQQFH